MTEEARPSDQTRREYRREHDQPRFIYVVKRGDHLEPEVEGSVGRLILPWEQSTPQPEWADPVSVPQSDWAEDDIEVEALALPEGDWTVVPLDEAPAPRVASNTVPFSEEERREGDVALDDALPQPPAAFKKIRYAISKAFGKPGSTDDSGEPEFLDATSTAHAAEADGQGEWWDEPATAADHEMTVDPDSDAPEETEAVTGEQPLTGKEARAQKKADAAERAATAKEEKAHKAEAKRQAKLDAMSETKRQAVVEKEQKALEKKRLREAQDEQKIEEDEIKTRARREQKQNSEWKRKQKRREAVRRNGGKEGFWQGTSAPKPIEIANAIRSLAIILETSPAEIDAVKMMAEEYAGNRIGDAFDRIFDRLVKDNLTLVDAFAPEDLFPPVVHNMLKVGAKTAKPGASLRTAVDLLDNGNDNKRAMRNAVMEPTILAIASLAVLFVTAWGVMPIFLEMYESMDLKIGAITQFVLVFADVSMWAIGILAVISALFGIWWFGHGRSSLRVRIAIDRWKLHAPLIGKGEQSGEAFQMFNILDSYLSVGTTEREALLNTANAMENRAIKRHLRATANGLTRGEKTFAQFLDDDMFPRMARSLLGAGQRTGQVDQVVKNLRDIYQKEAEIEGKQSVEKVVGLVSALSSILFTVTATIITIPPLEIFGSTLSYSG